MICSRPEPRMFPSILMVDNRELRIRSLYTFLPLGAVVDVARTVGELEDKMWMDTWTAVSVGGDPKMIDCLQYMIKNEIPQNYRPESVIAHMNSYIEQNHLRADICNLVSVETLEFGLPAYRRYIQSLALEEWKEVDKLQHGVAHVGGH